MRSLLVCHEEECLDRDVLPSWLASFSELSGIVVIRETGARKKARIQRELKRVGPIRFLDVVAFRVYWRVFLKRHDDAWRRERSIELLARYGEPPGDVKTLTCSSPNEPRSESFMRDCSPDIVIARCKVLLKERVFAIARHGTFVMHPGVCPEYRNSHGCFWALARGDRERVGMTLLKVDRGADTGPVYSYHTVAFDEGCESHAVIQDRVVFDNLDAIADKLLAIAAGTAVPIDTAGRSSRAWGQPWLTAYLGYRLRARRQNRRA